MLDGPVKWDDGRMIWCSSDSEDVCNNTDGLCDGSCQIRESQKKKSGQNSRDLKQGLDEFFIRLRKLVVYFNFY